MSGDKRLKIILLYRTMIPSVRLCGHCQLEHLAQQDRIEYRAIQMGQLKDSDLNWANLVVIGRLDGCLEEQVAKRVKRAGKRLAYILDDDLLNIPAELSSGAYYRCEDRRRRILNMLCLSDALISPSPILLEKYTEEGARPIQIEEPALSPVPYTPHTNPVVKIGFAGSIDRVQDLEHILKNALARIHKEFKKEVQFEFFGAIPSFAGDIDAKCIPYCDSYEQYRETLDALEWDIGLAPIPDTPFHRCKHYNKYCEYAAAAVVGVFSDLEPYSRVKHMADAGVFCENTEEAWFQAIKRLILNPQEREQRRQTMAFYAQTVFSLEASADVLLRELQELEYADEKKIRAVVFRYKLMHYVCVGLDALKTYKFGILKKIFIKFLGRIGG